MLINNMWNIKNPTKVSLLRPKSINETLIYSVGMFILCNQGMMQPQTS